MASEYPIKVSKFLIGSEREHRLMIDRDLQKLYQLEQDQKTINDDFQDAYSYATAAISIYVDSTGDDSNSGSAAKPFKTIQRAVNYIPTNIKNFIVIIHLAAGDTFAECVYVEERLNGIIWFIGAATWNTTQRTISGVGYNSCVVSSHNHVRFTSINFQSAAGTNLPQMVYNQSGKFSFFDCTFGKSSADVSTIAVVFDNIYFNACSDGTTPSNFRFSQQASSKIQYVGTDFDTIEGDVFGESLLQIEGDSLIILGSSSNLRVNMLSTDANYNMTNTNEVLLGDATSGDITFALPAAANNEGKVYNIKKTDASANKVIIEPAGVETVDSATTSNLLLQNQAISIVSDGTEWQTLSKESITNFNINSATITNFISENASITNLAIGAIYPSNITINSLSCTTITCGDIDTVNLNATGDTNLALTTITNLSSDNITSTNLGITGNTNLGLTTLTNLNANNITTGNLGVTGELHAIDLTATNLSVSGNTNLGDLTASAIACISVESSSAALGQLTATNFTTYNISATNLGVSGAANIANLTTTTLVATNASITNLAIAALYPSNVTLNSFSCTTINCGDLTTTNLGVSGNTHLRDTTANNANLTTLNATNITATGLGVTGNTNLGLTTVTNLNATNISATNIGATGEVNGATGVFTSLTATNLNVSGNTNVANITCTNINLEGGQIRFPASASASSEVNTLDDYEEGYYTATLTCGTSGTITLASNFDTLAYTKIGRLVTIQGGLGTTSISSPVGDLRLNLPFAITGLTEFAERTTGSVMPAGIIAIGSAGALGILALSGSSVSIVERTTTSVLLDVANHIDADCNLYISFRYISE